MEFDGSFEDFQETKQLASARKTNLRNKLLKRKKVSESTSKSESVSRRNIKKFSSSQPTLLAQNGTPVLKTNTLSTKSQQDVLDIARAFSQPVSSTKITAHTEVDNVIPHTQISNKQLIDADENVVNKSTALNNQNCESPIINIATKSDLVGHSNDANTETVNCDIENHGIRCDVENRENSTQSDPQSTTQSNENPIQPDDHVASSSNDQTSLSLEADPIWQCPMCKESIASVWRDSHLSHCLKKFEHKKSTSVQSPSSEIFTCDICKLDITSLSTLARSEHVNRCLDCQIENIKPKNVSCNNIPSEESELIIAECPLCNRKCSSTQAKLAHVKKCSQALGIDVQSVIVALQLQKKHAVEKISLGLPLVPTKTTIPKTKPTTVRKHVKEPKSEADADVQLAKALSLSIKEDEKRKNLLELSAFDEMKSLDGSADEFQAVQLQPPKMDQKPGGRKRKPSKKTIPLLLLRTDDERMKLLQERVSAIIVAPQFSEEPVHSDKAEEPSAMDVDDCCIINHEKDSALWNLCGKAEERKAYYTLELMEFITPCGIEPGSKLKSLSQIPGHCIYTQQPYDFTFSGPSQHQEKNDGECFPASPSNTPTTQEMVDIIVQDNGSSENEASQIPLDNKKDEFNSDGFLRIESKPKVFLNHDSVISCLETLVNNTWMSDVNISVSDGSLVPAHKLLLMLRCPGLREELTNVSDGTLYWNDISNEVCTNFLNFVYTGSTSWSPSMSSKMLILIKRCKMKEFEELKKVLDPNHTFVEDTASQQTSFPNADLQKEDSVEVAEPVIVHDVSSSGHEDSSHEAVTENSLNKMNLGKCNSTFADQFNFTSHNLVASSTHLQTIDLEKNAAAENSMCKTAEHGPMVSKYFSDSNEEVDVECLEVSHISETKLSSGINQTYERESSPDLFICDSDDEIPSNQEIIFEKSNSNRAGSESSLLTLQPSCSIMKGFRTCNYAESTAIVPSPTSPHSLSQSQRHRLSYSPDSSRNCINTTIQLCSSTDVSDCQQDKDVICITESENNINHRTPHTKNPIINNYNASHATGGPELFRLHPEDSNFLNNTALTSLHDKDCGAASVSQIQDDENEVNCQTPHNKNPIDGGYVRSYRKGDPELFKLHPEDSSFWNDTTVMSPHAEDCGATTLSQIQDEENEINCYTPHNKNPIHGGYVRSYRKGDPELFKLHAEDSSFWNNTTVMSPHAEDSGASVSQIQDVDNEINCHTPHNKNPIDGGYVRSYRKGDPELFKLHPEESSFWNNTTVMPSDEDTNAKTISDIEDENDEQFCEELCHISPSKKNISPMMDKSLSDANSFLLNTPLSTRKVNGKTQNIGLRNGNRDAAASVNECSSADMNHSYDVLLNDSFFGLNTRVKSNQSEFHHKNSRSDDEITSVSDDNFPNTTFQSPLFDEIAVHEETPQNRTDPVDSEVCDILQHAPSQDINQRTYVINRDSPIILSSDDENDEALVNQQRPKSRSSSEIISSDSENEVVQYSTGSTSDKEQHLTTGSPCKSKSFPSTSQAVQLSIDTDEEEEQILPLHLRLQKLMEKEKEQEKVPSQRDSPSPLIDVEGDSNELPFVSLSTQSSQIIPQEEGSNECVEGRACTPDLHKQVKRLKNAECIISDSPITPLPDYQAMVTPEIKMALKKYGVRAVPRKKAVAILSHIYDETHPIVNASGDIINEPGTPHLQKTSSSQPCKRKQPTKKRKIASQDPEEHATEATSSKSTFSKKIKTSKKRSKSPKSFPDDNVLVSNEATENREEFCGSQNSSKSDISDMPEESFFESDEVFGSQKYENDSSVTTKITDYIRLNKKLYSKILMYEPLNLSSFQQELKENGIKISATNLMNFLDEECITFTLPRSEKYKKKQQQRTQRFRKRMIEKQSQQCSQSCS